MIVPYYNCLLLGHKYNEIELGEEGEQLVKDYLEEYLASSLSSKKISITCLGQRNANILNRVRNILHVLITNLSIAIYEINSTYTSSEQMHEYHQALKELTVREEQANKKPAVIENMNSLKNYYSKYQSENQMKLFLKSLLVKEINHQKRCIIYHQSHEIKSIINQKIQSLKGDIQISLHTQSSEDNFSVQIILVNQKTKESNKLQSLIRNIEKQFIICKTVNPQITAQYTLQYLRKIAVSQFESLISPYYRRTVQQHNDQIKTLKQEMTIIANLRAIMKEGFRLAEQQVKLQQQFLAFVSEMNVKYTNQICKYFVTFRQIHSYSKQHKLYCQSKRKKEIICAYMKGKLEHSKFQFAKRAKRNNQVSIIQTRIRAFLIQQRQYHTLMNAYLLEKHCISNKYRELYSQIISSQNEMECKKLASFNRYKYGFSCCIYLIDITNTTNCIEFQPSIISELFQKINKSQELLTKMKGLQFSVQIQTIEGRVFKLSEEAVTNSKNKQLRSLCDSNKQNAQTNNSSYQSIIHQFDSESKLNQINSRLTESTSKVSISKRQNLQSKPKYTKIIGINYEFKLEESGRLYGKGKNRYGQLGIQNQQFVNDFTPVLPFEKIKLIATGDNHTIVVTKGNKLFHFGRTKGKLPSSKTPTEFGLRQKFITREIVITYNDVYFLTENYKVYSLELEKTVRIPKQIELAFDHFHLIRTGGQRLQITYLIGYWINSLDAIKKQEIEKYLIEGGSKIDETNCQSILVDGCWPQERQKLKQIHQLSAILEQSII